jgi:pimeloyl-ACP methyl ester carboxylesterase
VIRLKRVMVSLVWVSLLITLAACTRKSDVPAVTTVAPSEMHSQTSAVGDNASKTELESAPTKVPPETIAFSPRVEERPCELWIPAGDVANETLHCGYVVVPAERDNPQSEEVKLAYILLKATGDNPAPDPIIHVSGGPGISATTRLTVVELIKRYAPLRKTRDIILYDQRGVGNSLPVLDCYLFMGDDAGEGLTSKAEELSRCQEAMRNQGYPPETFATAVSAADLLDLMHALNYPAYNLYGISYGSRLLMSLMHHFPNEPLVRSILLDSVDTLPEDFNTAYIAGTYLLQQALFESVFEACAANPECSEAYPDLRVRFNTLIEQLNRSPLKLDEFTMVDGDTIYRNFFPFNNAVQNIPYLPRMIDELEQGDTTTLDLIRSYSIPEPATRTYALPEMPEIGQELLDLYLNCEAGGDDIKARQIALWDADPQEVADFLRETCDQKTAAAAIEITDSSPGIFNHIITRFADDGILSPNKELNSKLNCTEQYPFREDFAEIEQQLLAAGMPNFFIEQTLETINLNSEWCEVWVDALKTPTPERYGDYPTLILNGQFDSLTPPAFAQIASDAIPWAQYVPIPSAWHSILGNNDRCPTEITLQFLVDPDAPVGAGCTKEMFIEFLQPSTAREENGEIQMKPIESKPYYVNDLEAAYGPPSQEAFGSAVFFELAGEDDDLEDLTKDVYQTFVGDKWQEWGEEAWMSPWKEAYRRPDDIEHDVLAELRAIEDFQTQLQVEQILDNIEDSQKAQQAVAAAYDPVEVVDLRAFNIGDGDVMSGLIIAGRRVNGEATFLVFLLD